MTECVYCAGGRISLHLYFEHQEVFSLWSLYFKDQNKFDIMLGYKTVA